MVKICKHKLKRLAMWIMFAFFSIGAQLSHAATLYVATNGNDGAAGTLSAPLKTISRAASMATPGSSVIVRGGVYGGSVSISRSGTASAPIYFQSYPGETAIIDGSGTAAKTDLVTISANYIVFKGFEIRNATGAGVDLYQTSFVNVSKNVIHNSYSGGIWVGADTQGASHDNVIQDNTIYNNCLSNSSGTAGSWPVAVNIVSDRTLVSNNRVYGNYGEGIGTGSSTGVRIVGNEVFDNYSMNIYLDNASSTVVDSNFSYSTGNTKYFRRGSPAVGIGLARENTAIQMPLSNITVVNNIVVGTLYSFYYGNYEHGGGIQNSLVANNTFVNATKVGVRIDADNHSGNQFVNNIVSQSGSTLLVTANISGWKTGSNCYYSGSAGGFSGRLDVNANPLFMSLGALAANAYKLRPESPCLSFGSPVPLDYWGQTRILSAPEAMGASTISSSATP
jgi:hypothetical protein